MLIQEIYVDNPVSDFCNYVFMLKIMDAKLQNLCNMLYAMNKLLNVIEYGFCQLSCV